MRLIKQIKVAELHKLITKSSKAISRGQITQIHETYVLPNPMKQSHVAKLHRFVRLIT